MKGIEVKERLQKNKYSLKEIADLMGETPQNFQAMFKVEDIKTGVLERIAKAIGKDILFFFDNIDTLDSQYNNQLDEMIEEHLRYIQFYAVSILYHLRHINELTGGKFDNKQFKKEEGYAEQFKIDFEEPFYKKYSTKEKLVFIKELSEATKNYFNNMFKISREIHNSIEQSDNRIEQSKKGK